MAILKQEKVASKLFKILSYIIPFRHIFEQLELEKELGSPTRQNKVDSYVKTITIDLESICTFF